MGNTDKISNAPRDEAVPPPNTPKSTPPKQPPPQNRIVTLGREGSKVPQPNNRTITLSHQRRSEKHKPD